MIDDASVAVGVKTTKS